LSPEAKKFSWHCNRRQTTIQRVKKSGAKAHLPVGPTIHLRGREWLKRADLSRPIVVARTTAFGAQATPLTATGMVHLANRLGRQATTAYIS
jgi:hypothetical protein